MTRKGSKKGRKKGGRNSGEKPVLPVYSAPIIPGGMAKVRNLQSRTDLNGTRVTIQEILYSGRVAVEVLHLAGSPMERTEVVAIRPENLEMEWENCVDSAPGDEMKNWGLAAEECPVCMDSIMNTGQGPRDAATSYACCGGRICRSCFVKTQLEVQGRDTCPLCRADTSDDISEVAERKKVEARANRGNANAMYNMGGYYDSGLMGVPQDQAIARIWYEKAALKGECRAANNLGCSHRDGEGGPVNKTEAIKWFRMAAEMGHIQSTTNLGMLLMPYDKKEAKKWLTKSAKAGDSLAMHQLGFLDMMGSGTNGMSFTPSGDMRFRYGG